MAVQAPVNQILLSTREAAAALSVCERTLFSITAPRGPIEPVRIGKRILYRRADLERFAGCGTSESDQSGN